MIDMELVLGYLTPRMFFMAMCLDLVNSVLPAIGNKNILTTLHTEKGNEKEHENIVKAIKRVMWRYLPVFLFLLVDMARINLNLDLYSMRIAHFFLEAWALIYSWNILGFNINLLGGGLNMLACAANRGMMPTIYPPELDGRHILMTDVTRLNFLCDWIVTGNLMISIGDVLIAAGVLIFMTSQFYIFFKIILNRTADLAVK